MRAGNKRYGLSWYEYIRICILYMHGEMYFKYERRGINFARELFPPDKRRYTHGPIYIRYIYMVYTLLSANIFPSKLLQRARIGEQSF